MKIAIIGSRGIPARYGGFEVCAEKLSNCFMEKELDVTVYTIDDPALREVVLPVKRVFIKSSRWMALEKLSLSTKSICYASVGIGHFLNLDSEIKNEFNKKGYSFEDLTTRSMTIICRK